MTQQYDASFYQSESHESKTNTYAYAYFLNNNNNHNDNDNYHIHLDIKEYLHRWLVQILCFPDDCLIPKETDEGGDGYSFRKMPQGRNSV